ncbi:MAG: hypothetical protein IH865_07890 [Chloroflexi bacterium]|nr:hypothetical protein [Chloroflexota bacterium]
MARFQFERESRTSYSESYSILIEQNEIGRVDVHFGEEIATATLCVPEDFSESDVQELIGAVDERLVMTARPFREDFVCTVWLGRHAGVYSEEMEEADGGDSEGNGHVE